MDNLEETKPVETQQMLKEDYPEDLVYLDQEDDNFMEQLLRNMILAYQEAWNRNSDKYEMLYNLTLSTHKVPTPEGNKDIAYLRLQRAVKPKGENDDELSFILIHQEMYIFRDIKEQANPRAPWREQLYTNFLMRLTAAGLEYAELLKRMENTNLQQLREEGEKKSDLIITDQMPKPLSPGEEDYKKWVDNNNVYAKDK